MKRAKDIDQLFKQGLSDPEIPFNEMDWEKMEQKLDAGKKKSGLALWIFAGASIAAVILVFLFWVLQNPVPADKSNMNNHLTKIPPVIPKVMPPATLPFSKNVDVAALIVKPIPLVRVLPTVPAAGHALTDIIQPIKVAMDTVIGEKEELAKNLVSQKKANGDEVLQSIRKKMNASLNERHGLTLSLMAAPDVSTAQQSLSSKVSVNAGILATYDLTNKFSVTSGAIYSKKYYNSGSIVSPLNVYGSADETSQQVNADCNVLDIPLNVNYKLLNKKGLSVSINTGLSSYFMLKEKYTFIKGDQGPAQQISKLEINNQNQHLFGIANISMSFEHKISRGVSVGLQPFMKLPLTGIGYGNANLKSTGVSFSLNLGLFPVKKTTTGYAAL